MSALATIYYNLIKAGTKKITDVPERVKDEVKKLIDANKASEKRG